MKDYNSMCGCQGGMMGCHPDMGHGNEMPQMTMPPMGAPTMMGIPSMENPWVQNPMMYMEYMYMYYKYMCKYLEYLEKSKELKNKED